jgi:dienelactone hydrolase
MTRDLETVRAILRERAIARRGPFEVTSVEEVEAALGALRSLEPDHWAATWTPFGDRHAAAGEHLIAANYYRVARYPYPSSAGKRLAYRRSIESYLVAARAFDPPLQRVEIPLGTARLAGYLREPATPGRPPLLITWGGIDSYKEDRRTERFLARGIATLAIDMPGTGEMPALDRPGVDRMWDALLAWARARSDRVGVYGRSSGGYWAAKLAHTHRDLLACAVDHGGPIHHAFDEAWIRRAGDGEYPFELAESLVRVFATGTTEDDWIRAAPSLSLVRQGLLDQPCCPMLLVNGARDTVFPIADLSVLLEHGDPKTARVFDGGHMGPAALTEPAIVEWVAAQLVRR